ncbi:helix-turn-helix domain-containing protein [Sanguibacter antarcticus]|uniref:helix-turn-helix domain-containing protein n=1 Tax=Sanguibacter antarcticus TaxID=372484 RepID=UPI00117BD737|nr:helix-turn-helix domain-containing protein [Sanguibacter antarcticus]
MSERDLADVGRLRAARARQAVARLDYLRGVRALSRRVTQVELARVLGVSQSAVSRTLSEEAKIPPVRAGFHGGGPVEVIQRFMTGELSREQVVDELVSWPYEQAVATGVEGPPIGGSFDDVVRCVHEGLLPPDLYDAVRGQVVRPGVN